MRSEIERDEQRHVSKLLAGAATAATATLQDAFEAATLLRTNLNELAAAMPRFQEDLAGGNQQQPGYVRQFWSEIEQVRGGLRDILQDFDGVRNGLRNTRDEAQGLGLATRKAAVDSNCRHARTCDADTTRDAHTIGEHGCVKRSQQAHAGDAHAKHRQGAPQCHAGHQCRQCLGANAES